MGDIAAPPLADATSNDELAPKVPVQSSPSPAGSDKTITPPLPDDIVVPQPQLGPGSAMFSTDLGKRAPRKLQGPPYAPVIVRSDRIHGVLMTAAVWRNKYPYQYLCIFPQSGWQIGDLWDEEDVHLETESFCKELLQFIERDVCVRAQNFAQHWSRQHPERLHIVGGDLVEIYDKENHLSIVDKIFVNGEQQEYPPIFLWHVAHTMRTAMLAVKGVKLPANDRHTVTGSLETVHGGPVPHSTAQVPATPVGTASLPPVLNAATKSSTYIANPSPSGPVSQPMPTYHDARPLPRMQSNGPPHHGGRYVGPLGVQTGELNLVQPSLHVTKNRPGRPSSGIFNQGMPSGPYGENMPRAHSGSYPRHHSGSMPMSQSPRLRQAPMTMNQPMVNVPHGMAPMVYEQNAMTPGMVAGPSSHPGIMHPSLMPLHSAQSTSMMQGHPPQLSGSQGPPYAAPMGDVTNMHYPPSVYPHQIDHHRPGERRYSQQYGNGSALYDPYQGINPVFKAGKKENQSGFQNSNNRQRRTSIPGQSQHSQYTNDRPSHTQPGGRPLGPKSHSEDDLAITQDLEYGCHTNRIGAQNTTVTEIFIGDLPEDIQDAELAAMFQDRINIRPKSIITRHAFTPHENYLGRKHAFVAFASATESRQAISISDPTIRGLSVSITVPKRFFQRMVDVSKRDTIDPAPPFNSRFISHANNRETRNRVSSIKEENDITPSIIAAKDEMSYSPQDARSDLHKKKKGKQPQQGSTAVGSPEARKAKPKQRQESLKKKELTEPALAAQDDALNEVSKVNDNVFTSGPAKATPPVEGAQSEQSLAHNDPPSEPKKETPSAVAEGPRTHTPHEAEAASGTSPHEQQPTASQRAKPQLQEAVQKVDSQVKEVMQTPAKEPTEVGVATMEPWLTDPIQSGDVATHDALKNDSSAHTAEESQTGSKLTAAPGAISQVASQGTNTPSPKDAESSTTISSPHTSRSAPADDILSTAAAESSTMVSPVGRDLSATVSTAPNMPSTDSKSVELTGGGQSGETSCLSCSFAPESTKKSGVQHTESLHPFSKVSKAQAKKEKEQKRKALKKEKEQADKAKAAKAAAIKPLTKSESNKITSENENTPANNVATNEAVVTAGSEPAEKNPTLAGKKGASELLSTDPPVKKLVSTPKITKAAVDGRDKPGKHKGKRAETVNGTSLVTAESKDDDHGKQAGGTISIPNETGSVTKKEVKFDQPEDGLNLDAQSSKQDLDKVELSDAYELDATATTKPEASKSAKKKKPRKKKPRRVWPSLEFRPKSPNPPWMGPIDMATDVQNYHEIMREAMGDSDDTDFSWDGAESPPRHGSSEDERPSSVSDNGGYGHEHGHGNKHSGEAAKPTAASETQQAAHTLVSLKSTATNFSQEKQELGEALYPQIVKLQPELVGQITGMLLGLDNPTIIDLLSDNSALRAKVDEAMISRNNYIKSKGNDGEKEFAVKFEPRKSSLVSKDDEAVIKRVSEFVNDQIDAKTKQLDAAAKELSQHLDSQTPLNAASPDSQLPKKKKTNKKKKRTQPNAEPVEVAQVVETTETEKPTPQETARGSIDTNDPFYDQLKGIDAIKRGDAVMADVHDAQSQHHADIVKSLTNPHFLRTMEGYFKETQDSSQSKGKGRKVSKEDLL